jgi:hypothetical protein
MCTLKLGTYGKKFFSLQNIEDIACGYRAASHTFVTLLTTSLAQNGFVKQDTPNLPLFSHVTNHWRTKFGPSSIGQLAHIAT